MRWTAGIVLFFSALTASAAGPPEPKIVSGQSVARSAASAVWKHVRNSPREWGGGIAGFTRRFASSFGHSVAKNAIQAGVSTIRGEDLRYIRSQRRGFTPRLKYAVTNTFVARKRITGRPTPATARFAGAVGGGFVSRLWQPARLRTISSGLSTAGWSLAGTTGLNVTREFWPEIRRPWGRPRAASPQPPPSASDPGTAGTKPAAR